MANFLNNITMFDFITNMFDYLINIFDINQPRFGINQLMFDYKIHNDPFLTKNSAI